MYLPWSVLNLLALNRKKFILSQITGWATHSGLASCSQRPWVHLAGGQGHVPTDGVAALRTLPCPAVPGWRWSGGSGWHGWTPKRGLSTGRKFHIWGSWHITEAFHVSTFPEWNLIRIVTVCLLTEVVSKYPFFSCGVVRLSPLGTLATIWPTVPALDNGWWWWRLWSSRWNENWQGKPKYSEETCSTVTLSTTNPTWPDLGSNLGRCSGKLATNHLSCGTVLYGGKAHLDLGSRSNWVVCYMLQLCLAP
jgi:hypothetical protein